MPLTILKPHALILKNRIWKKEGKLFINRDLLATILTIGLLTATYQGAYVFLSALRTHPNFHTELFTHLIGLSLSAFLLLLLFSNSIAALGYLFTAKDIPLLLYVPISPFRIYCARLVEITATSSWIFLIFFIPIIVATKTAFGLPLGFVLVSMLTLLPFLILPAVIGTILITIFVNVIPPHRIKDLLVGAAFLLMIAILMLNNQEAPQLGSEHKSVNDLIVYLKAVDQPMHAYLPSTWAARIIGSFIEVEEQFPFTDLAALLATATLAFIIGSLFFTKLFHRGFSITTNSRKQPKVYSTGMSGLLGNALFAFSQQLRGLATKELRMFIRDTTQSLQLLMLLLLTFVYLWNFRSLRVVPDFSPESMAWWKVILAVSNTAFGACVVSAIATRFVFPSVSLEGRAYFLIRCTPMSIRQIVTYKFFTWLWPVSGLSLILFLSGAFAIDGNIQMIWATIFIALSMSIGIVGLAIGIGAVYSRFDWESPTQVTASFGSLVYMLLALALVLAILLPTTLLFVMTSVLSLSAQMSQFDYTIALTGSTFLILFINVAVARKALSAGVQRLQDAEK